MTQIVGDQVNTYKDKESNNDSDNDVDEGNRKISSFQAAAMIFKGSIGTGILGLPYSVKNCGILIGTIALSLLGIVTIYCMHLIIICSRFLANKYGANACDYGDVAELSVREYGSKASLISKFITNLFITFTQMGFLCVYVVFIWATIDHYLPESNHFIVFGVLFVLLLAITCTSNIVIIGYFSTLASIIQCSCLTLLFIYLFLHFNGSENLKLVGDYRTLPLFFGTAMFAFEGIAIILPIENQVKRPDKFFFIIDISMGVVCLLYISSGFLGYAAYGENVRGSVTLNLPHNWFSMMIEFGYVIAIFFSYPIQFYVPMKIIGSYIELDGIGVKNTVTSFLIRVTFVLFTCVAAVMVPKLENILSLSGSFAAASISLVFPSVFHLCCFKNQSNFPKSLLILDIFIIVVGLAGCILGTYSATLELVS